jgi:2-keto-4-pentenoate hydratase/2-oxohepta-3-ene-1,7-dioic acid hydratase in catechol pathway
MRLISFGNRGNEEAGVLIDDRVVAIRDLDPAEPRSVRQLLGQHRLPHIRQLVREYAPMGVPIHSVRIGPPIPDPSKILCVGLNFRGHASEQRMISPKNPLVFCKSPNALAGPYDDVLMPNDARGVDFEIELAVVIGTRISAARPDEVMAAIAGFMVGNDVTERIWQREDVQYYHAKSCDTFYPCGPALVTSDEIDDYRKLRLMTVIDGMIRQDASAGDLIHHIPEAIAYISRDITLEPGDIVSMGSPAGSGGFQDPPTYLRAGDVVECAITGIGMLRNRFSLKHPIECREHMANG